MTKDELLEIIYQAVEEFNGMQEDDEQLQSSPDEVLFSRPGFTEKGVLDSMGLVNFLVTLDEIFDNDQNTVGLSFDISKALEQKETALATIGTLADYILAANPQK